MKMFRWLLSLLLLGRGAAAQFSKEAIIDRIQYCLEEGKVLALDKFSKQEDDCFAPLTQGPCKETEWWVQRKPDVLCSGLECKVPVKYLTGVGKCVTKHCSLPKVYYNGACIDNQLDVCKEIGKGKSLIVNLQGESVCECGQGWAIDKYGECAFLFSQGNCGEGNLFVKREHALDIQDVQDLDVPCRNNRPCQQKCEHPAQYFIETLKDEYGCYDDICKVGGRKGFCCPDPGPGDDIILWFINRLHFAEYTRAICIRNPCPAGEILFHDIREPTDINEVNYDKMICTPAERDVLTCKGEIDVSVNGTLTCCRDSCITIFGLADTNRPRCRARYFYHPRRRRCVRGYG